MAGETYFYRNDISFLLSYLFWIRPGMGWYWWVDTYLRTKRLCPYGTYGAYGTYGIFGAYGTYGAYGAFGTYGTYGTYITYSTIGTIGRGGPIAVVGE